MRLIDADALLDDVQKHTSSYVDDFVKELVDKQPTVDAVTVVRCKDCKHYGISETLAFGLPVKMCRYWVYEDMDDDEFCSRAERKEREGNES